MKMQKSMRLIVFNKNTKHSREKKHEKQHTVKTRAQQQLRWATVATIDMG